MYTKHACNVCPIPEQVYNFARNGTSPFAVQAEANAKMPTSSLDVSNSVVETSFRTGTEAAESEEQASTSTIAQILFVSESNVCRSVLAAAILKQQLEEHNLDAMVNVESKVGSDSRTSASCNTAHMPFIHVHA